ncbi:MAG: 30S ribosomal protein S17 [Candidatus Peribacteria bacterium]|jgi:small subunit ribosomal protein S17|nr:30S ribosomal protein S17 [Candidatus Peribacteria bacterium]GHV23152.1 30S ribosomal protein S17 [Clostridia bacterium]
MTIIGDKNIKELIGEVVSDKMQKTRVVMVKSVQMHPIYKKRFVVRKKYYAHDTENATQIGDTVKIRAIPPLSKLIRWEIVK